MMEAYRELIDAVSETPRRLQALPYDRERSPRSAQSWSAREVLEHLVEVERVYRDRIQRILTQETPYLRSVDFEAVAAERSGVSRSPTEILDEFARERGEMISTLLNLSMKDWERTGIHDEFGEVSIADLIERLIDHDAEHVAQITALIEA